MPRMLPILPQAKPESCRAEGDQGGRAVADRSPQRREMDANDGPVVPATVKFELPRDDASYRLEQRRSPTRRLWRSTWNGSVLARFDEVGWFGVVMYRLWPFAARSLRTGF